MTPRGCDPDDARRFDDDGVRRLTTAASELAWLLERSYPLVPSLALVGDRHGLDARARLALQRCAAAPSVCSARASRRVREASLEGATLEIDAFNLLVTLEVALSRGPLFVGLDGAVRDLAGLRGSYRLLPETDQGLSLLANELTALRVARCRWWIDAPVSNAGALAARLRAWHASVAIEGEVELVRDADPVLAGRELVVSSDARVIDEARSWVSLARYVTDAVRPAAWVVDLSMGSAPLVNT